MYSLFLQARLSGRQTICGSEGLTLLPLHHKERWCASLNMRGSRPKRGRVWGTALLGLGPRHGSENQQPLRKRHESALRLKD